jgi:CheY-like chemotaxis protein
MDMRMPVMDGVTATREIRKIEAADGRHVPIIALTANAFEEDIKACLAAGMDAHLSKPVDIDQVIALLGRVLASR